MKLTMTLLAALWLAVVAGFPKAQAAQSGTQGTQSPSGTSTGSTKGGTGGSKSGSVDTSGMPQPTALESSTAGAMRGVQAAPSPGGPCCAITAIDARSGVVTARETATGRTFQFRASAEIIRGLRVGQAVHANFTTMQVSVRPDGMQPCCGIVSQAGAAGQTGAAGEQLRQRMAPVDPCCGITAIDVRTGIVTARETATGRTFQFRASAEIIRGLRVGQAVHANFTTMQVSVRPDGAQPCCGIVSQAGAASPAGPTAGPGGPRPKYPVALGQRLGLHSLPSENEGGESDPPLRLPASPRSKLAGLRQGSRILAVKDHPQAQQVLNAVAQAVAQVNMNVALLGGHKYMINDCLGVKASAGEFTLRASYPTAVFEGAAMKIQAGIDRIALNVLTVRMKPNVSNPLQPCQFSRRFSIGGRASNVVFEMRLGGPTLDLDQCRVATLGPVHTRWRIGGLNLQPLQNNLDEVAKEMVEDALSIASSIFMDPVTATLERALDAVCESKVMLYRRYMDQLGAGVTLYHLPAAYVAKLKSHYAKVRLESVRFGHASRQPAGNATTDCHNIYFNGSDYVNKIRTATVYADVYWLYHELRHTEQCSELGGRDFYAERWFGDLEISALTTNLNNPDYYKVLHDRMPMEKDADARGKVVQSKVPSL